MSRAESAVLNLSDLHGGKETQSFNLSVLNQRMSNAKKNVLSILKILHRSYKIEELVIPFLGDCIDNDSIYKTHAFHTDKSAPAGRQQVKELTAIMQPWLTDLQKQTGLPLKIKGIRGNHGRVSRFTHEANNFDLMYYDTLQAAFGGNKKISVDISDDFATIIEVQGHGILLYHGAGIRMYQSLPWYGIVQRVMRWKQSMRKEFGVVCLGHFHTLGHMRWIGTDILLNGTPVSDDDFAMENLGMDGEPSFWFFGVHPEKRITWKYSIDLLH